MIVKGQTGKTECFVGVGLGKEKGNRAPGCSRRRTLDCQQEGNPWKGTFPARGDSGIPGPRVHAYIPARRL